MSITKKITLGFGYAIAAGAILTGVAWAAFGDKLADFIPSVSGNGRAVAFDGTTLYYTRYSDPGVIYKTDPTNSPAVALATSASFNWGALAWDSTNNQLWGARYGDFVADFYTIDEVTGLSTFAFNFAFPSGESCYPGNVNNPDGLAYDATDNTLWISDDAATNVYHVDTSGAVLSSFVVPNGKCNTGLAVNGKYLWMAVQSGADLGPHDIYRVDKTNPTVVLSTIPFGVANNPGPEDLELDLVTYAPDHCALWSNQFGADNHLIAWELEENLKPECTPDRTPPVAACVETVNPHGNNVPPAGSTTLPGPKGGQNEDGFYELGAKDDSGAVQIWITDALGSGPFGPFASGDKVKITEAPGATPSSKPMGSSNGQAGAIAAHITLNGDAIMQATDAAGNQTSVTCFVPPPPK